jgi:geranylgeranyl diphosphate synthase type I
VGAGGECSADEVLSVAAALELLHAFALLHDDVMDGSSTRRGRPTVHRRIAERHRREHWRGDPRRFGEGVAVLVGDLAFAYADAILGDVDATTRALWHELRIELTMGQYLDVLGAATGALDAQAARWVATLKSGRYTVQRPLQLGAALAGRRDLAPWYSAFGTPLGQAFQLRDDLLGVFGDPEATGKPVGDDLREGKATLLLAIAAQRARGEERRLLDRVGAPDLGDAEIAQLRGMLERCGARAEIEAAIAARTNAALAVLDEAPIAEDALGPLRELAALAAWRYS